MILEHTTFRLKHEKAGIWIAGWAQKILPVEAQAGGEFLGLFTTEVGAHLSEVILLRRFASMAERERCQAALAADARWIKAQAEQDALCALEKSTVRILRPAAFSPRLSAHPAENQ